MTINGTVTIKNMASGFDIGGFIINGSIGDLNHPQGVLDISNSGGLLKLSNLVVTNSDPTGQGIAIGNNVTANIEMTNVVCSGSKGGGMEIDTTGNVILTNTILDDNGGDAYAGGGHVKTKGSVTFNGVSASRNGGDGMVIDAPKSTVTIKNSVFDGKDPAALGYIQLTGLKIDVNIANLDNVQANNNVDYGIYSLVNTSFSGHQVQLSNNEGTGIYIDACNSDLDTDIFCDNTGAGTVTLKPDHPMIM